MIWSLGLFINIFFVCVRACVVCVHARAHARRTDNNFQGYFIGIFTNIGSESLMKHRLLTGE